MKYAVVGNRVGWTSSDVDRILDEYVNKDDTIISGGAIGVDSYAEWYAFTRQIKFLEFKPDDSLPSPEKYFKRNREMADACDVMISFDKKIGRSGTKNAVKWAYFFGKKVIRIGI